jgi:hypothetical protein
VGRLPDGVDPTVSGLRVALGERWVAELPPDVWEAVPKGWRLRGETAGVRKAVVRSRANGGGKITVRSGALDLSAIEHADQTVRVSVEAGPWAVEHTRRWRVAGRRLRPKR